MKRDQSYAPEQTLAGFTGNPNGRWVLNVCDDQADDFGSVRYVRLNFCSVPQITASSSNSPVCASGTLNLSVTATGTAPLTYAWTGTGTYSPDASNATPSVTGPATGNYNIAVSNLCGSTDTDVAVTVTPVPSTAAAGGDQSTCAVDAVTLAANTPAVGTGAWSIVSGPSTDRSQFSNTASPTSTFLRGFNSAHLERKWGNNFGYYLHLHGSPLFKNRNGVIKKLSRFELNQLQPEPSSHIVLTHIRHKPAVISSSEILSSYWQHLYFSLSESSEAVLFGYSGFDKHLNELLSIFSQRLQFKIVEWAGSGNHQQREVFWNGALRQSVNLIHLENILNFEQW